MTRTLNLHSLALLSSILVLCLPGHIKLSICSSIPYPSNNTLGVSDIYCTKSSAWISGPFYRNDFITAVDDLYNDALRRDSQPYEFLSPGVQKRSRLPSFNTPTKYSAGEIPIYNFIYHQKNSSHHHRDLRNCYRYAQNFQPWHASWRHTTALYIL